MWAAMDHLKSFVDVSDPDMTLPNIVHAFQTAQGLRAARMPDWLQLTGLCSLGLTDPSMPTSPPQPSPSSVPARP